MIISLTSAGGNLSKATTPADNFQSSHNSLNGYFIGIKKKFKDNIDNKLVSFI